jgi:hypothetical protein
MAARCTGEAAWCCGSTEHALGARARTFCSVERVGPGRRGRQANGARKRDGAAADVEFGSSTRREAPAGGATPAPRERDFGHDAGWGGAVGGASLRRARSIELWAGRAVLLLAGCRGHELRNDPAGAQEGILLDPVRRWAGAGSLAQRQECVQEMAPGRVA